MVVGDISAGYRCVLYENKHVANSSVVHGFKRSDVYMVN